MYICIFLSWFTASLPLLFSPTVFPSKPFLFFFLPPSFSCFLPENIEWFINEQTGFLPVVWFVSSLPSVASVLHIFLILPVCLRPSLWTGKEGGGGGWATNQKAWSSLIHSILPDYYINPFFFSPFVLPYSWPHSISPPSFPVSLSPPFSGCIFFVHIQLPGGNL